MYNMMTIINNNIGKLKFAKKVNLKVLGTRKKFCVTLYGTDDHFVVYTDV